MTALTVRPGSARDLACVWRRVYGEDPHAVAPLKLQLASIVGAGDPYLRHGEREVFVVEDADGPAGHAIASHDPRSSHALGARTGFFSHFESVDDERVVAALFRRLRAWFGERDIHATLGPMSPKITEPRGILVEGAGRPLYGMSYTPPYYERLLRSVGLRPVKDLLEFIITVRPPYARIERVAAVARARHPGLVVRSIDLRRIADEVATIVDVYNDAWQRNWGFIPLDAEELAHAFRGLRLLYRPEYATFVEIEGRCIGFLMTIPDLNEVLQRLRGRLLPLGWWAAARELRRITTYRGLFIGVRPAYRRSGIDGLLIGRVLNELAPRVGIRHLHVGTVLEDNYWWRRAIENGAGSDLAMKRYRIFGASHED